MTIENQYFVKDSKRDMCHLAEVKCAYCNESCVFPRGTPKVKNFVKILKAFNRLHTLKGCNNTNITTPEWASTEIEFSIQTPKVK